MKNNPPPDAAALRRLAEERLKACEGTDHRPSTLDTPRLLHELQVHQIELEMQNEELQQARARTDELLARYTDLYDFAPTGCLTLDREGAIRQVNLTGALLLGVERPRLANRRFGQFVAEGDRRVFSDFLGRVFAGQAKESCEVAVPREGSQSIVVRIEGRRTEDGQECRAAVLDITERKRAEGALKDSEGRYRQLVENVGSEYFFYGHDTAGVFTYLSPSITGMLGYSVDEFVTHYSKYLTANPINAETTKHTNRSLLGEEQKPYLIEIFHKDGSTRWLEVKETALRGPDGKVTGVEGLAHDITSRKRAEERLWMMAQMLNVAPASIVVHDTDGRILYGNRKAAELHECSPEELLGLNIQDRLSADDPLFLTRVQKIRDAGQASFEVSHLRKDGSSVPLHIQAHMTEWEGKPAILSVQMDLTERKQSEKALRDAEEQFRQAQKLEAIGQLAGGVAHDFNNILMAQMGYCELMQGSLRAEDPLAQDLAQVKACAERAAGLTRQLLAFSRKQTLQPQVLDLNAVVEEVDNMLRRIIGEDIDFTARLSAELGSVLADPGQIEQVIMNLAVNARDAMPQGGKLTVETANVELDAEYAGSHVSVVPGEYVLLAVTDTGCGMSEEVRSRLFEPFFTTKPKGKGTGLGLATVYGIVKQSGGNIWVYSEPGQGTTFKVYLPRVEAEPTPRVRQETPASGGQGELVLVVEDESSVRDLVRRILEKLGYRVRTAANGGEAVMVVEEEGLRPDLLISDVVMPGMGGKVLAGRLAKTQPGLKVLYMSGYTDNAIGHHGVLDPGTPFIQKPFSVGDLAARIGAMLRSGESAGG